MNWDEMSEADKEALSDDTWIAEKEAEEEAMEEGEGIEGVYHKAREIVREVLMQDFPQERKLELGFRMILEGLGVDANDPHFQATPERAARAWREELCRGLFDPPPRMTTFSSGIDGMIMLRDIPVRSLCAHHLLPFIGKAVIAYVPGTRKILGLSKLSRITDYYARRPQVQEELTDQIAQEIFEIVAGPLGEGATGGGAAVMIRANHLCMELRGPTHSGDMITSSLRGVFLSKPEARAEFFSLAGVDR